MAAIPAGLVTLCALCIITCCRGAFPECTVSTIQFEYRGIQNTTASGRTCQRWDAQSPHSHTYTDSLNYPDRDIQTAENYCRNPVPTDVNGTWCYTTDPAVRWEYCEVPMCSAYPECKLNQTGESYRGWEATTSSGATCEQWPVQDKVTNSNYCRNPDSKPGGPWCYTDPTYTQWEYCAVPFCKPSAWCTTTPDGVEYIGTIATTRSNIHCQRWDDTTYHMSDYNNDDDFPDATVADAADYCRNPRGDKTSPWCYTLHPNVTWDYCNIDLCAGCKLTELGSNYAGTTSITTSGYPCQRWDSQTPHPHGMTDPDMFPDKDLATSGKYCRNPDDSSSGPWCYTTDPDVTREACDVPICTGSDNVKQPTRGVKHVVHIGLDGLDPCFVDAPAPNIMNRIAAEGAWTMNARTTLETWSGPAWTSILCGGNSETTGVVDNAWRPGWLGYRQPITPASGNEVAMHCIFDVLKRQDQNIRVASLNSWPFLEYTASTGMPGRMDYDVYCDHVMPLYDMCDNYTAVHGSEYFSQTVKAAETSYTFIYQSGIDVAGHTYTWCSPEYMQQVRYVDGLVGHILDAIEEAGMEQQVLVVVTSDHSGTTGHGLPIDEHLITPMFFKGPGVKQDYEIQFVARNVDVTATIIQAMGYRPSSWWKGIPLNQIFV